MVNNKFYFSAKTQHENLGDAVINRELLRELKKYGQVNLFEGGMPASYLKFVKLPAVISFYSGQEFYIDLLSAALSALFNSNVKIYYVLNPGGFSGGVHGAGYLRQMFLVLMCFLLRIMNVRIVRLGASAGPYSSARICFERIKSALMYKNTVRDTVSLQYLKKSGFSRISLFPDWALMLQKEIFNKKSLESETGNSFSVFSFRSESKIAGYDESVKNTIDAILSTNANVRLSRFIAASQVEFDIPYNLSLAQDAMLKGMSIATYSGLEEVEYYQLYQSACCVFSNRLHVLLFALRQGTPAYAVIDPAVNTKVAGIYQDLGLADLIVDITKSVDLKCIDNKADFTTKIDQIFLEKQEQIAAQMLHFFGSK